MKDNIKSTIIISSISFGIGHIINLINGSGMDLVNNLCRIVYAVAMGFLFVTILYRGGSLLPCIIVHQAINICATFTNSVYVKEEMRILHVAIMILITVAYTLVLSKLLPKTKIEKDILIIIINSP